MIKRKIEQILNIGNKRDYHESLDNIKKQLSKYDIKESGLKVLIGPSFSIYAPLVVHDRLLNYALKLRGAKVVTMSCDSVQTVECNYFGGIWSSDTHIENCKRCMACSEKLWDGQGVDHLKLSNYISLADRNVVDAEIYNLDRLSWASYEKNGMQIGKWAKDILVNNYGVGDYHLIADHQNLGVNHIKNLLLVATAYEKIIEEQKPDRVVSNDSYYGMWAILESICRRKNIAYYSHWGPVNNGSWAYAFDDAAMNLDFSKPWKKFSEIPLTLLQTKKVNAWLDDRHLGKGMLIDTASLGAFKTDEFDLGLIDFTKPTAMLVANVIWDLAALNKQIVFQDMIDWIVQTISWFAEHQEFQLIIKPHPAEQHPSIPETTERVEVALSSLGVQLPTNVFLLSPKVKLTVYDLLPKLKVLLVHTTTVGIEAVALGLPVITTAHSPYRNYGFTEDPDSPTEYYTALDSLLGKDTSGITDHQKDLVYKFILFYHFYYYTNTKILDYKWGEDDVKVNIKSIDDLKSGKNPQWDYVIESILNGLPILSEDRWMPES